MYVSKAFLPRLAILKRERIERLAEYAAECEADRAEGYRPSHCIHGTYLWRDYDVICGPCEDGGNTIDPLAPYWQVLAEGKEELRRSRVVGDAVRILQGEDMLAGPEVARIFDRLFETNPILQAALA